MNKDRLYIDTNLTDTEIILLKDRIRLCQSDKITEEYHKIWLTIDQLKEVLKMEGIQELLKEI